MRKVDKQTGIPMDTINRPQFIDVLLTNYGERWRYNISSVDKWVICWAKANADLENVDIFKESIPGYQKNDFMLSLCLKDFDPNTHHLFTYDKVSNDMPSKEEPLYDVLHNDVTYNVPIKQYNGEHESFNTEHIIINRYNRKGVSYDEHIS
jgi:hypothetical protein